MYLDERYLLTYDIGRLMKLKGIIMSNTLRWVKFESVMTAIYGVNGITASKTCELTDHPISLLVHS